MTQALLETQNLALKFSERTLCDDVSLRVMPGEVWGLLGANGTGKTTLLKTLARLHEPSGGQCYFKGQPLANIGRRTLAQSLGYMAQDNLDAFPSSVYETALIGRHPYSHRWQFESIEDLAIVDDALKRVDLWGLKDRDVATLSGGERQRLAIATLMVQQPEMLIMDEPCNHLDVAHQVTLLQLLCEQVSAKAQGLLMSLHDINMAARFCHKLVFLFPDGDHLMGDSADLLTEEYLKRLYGCHIKRVETDDDVVFVPA